MDQVRVLTLARAICDGCGRQLVVNDPHQFLSTLAEGVELLEEQLRVSHSVHVWHVGHVTEATPSLNACWLSLVMSAHVWHAGHVGHVGHVGGGESGAK